VVGTFNAIPYSYRWFGKVHTFALSVDTMIAPEHRGGKHLVEMGQRAYEALIADSVPLIIGFPNEYYYRHEKRLFGTRDIAELDYYVLPINIGAMAPRFGFLNPVLRLIAKGAANLHFARRRPYSPYAIEKIVDDQFERHRYDETYSKHCLGSGGACVHKTYEEDGGVNVTYLIDVIPLTPEVFAEAVRVVYREVKTKTDMIIYVGKPPFSPPGLFRVPDWKKPQRVRMTGKILSPELVDERVFDVRNWNVNLSNIDVR
jgi:hypothetical protein